MAGLFAAAYRVLNAFERVAGRVAVMALLGLIAPATRAERLVLQAPEGGIPVGPASSARAKALALGVNYTGAQARWSFSSRWAAEGRYQHGKATSGQGDVSADVFGLRLYRQSSAPGRWPWYLGSELAYATAKAQNSPYKVNGATAGAFAGIEYRISRRWSLDVDLGPYVISLKESRTQETSTNLDFVLNTALLVRVF